MDRIVVVGAGLAGLRAAEGVRDAGFSGIVEVIGGEAHSPYTRPPLSKGYLTDPVPRDVAFRMREDLEIDWRLGVGARGLDANAQIIHLDDGRQLPYDGLVLATGSSARAWPGDPIATTDVLSLRTVEDAARLRVLLHGPPRRVVIVGAGFIGGEFASSARALGHEVALIDLTEHPLQGVLGSQVGAAIGELHRSCGVDVHMQRRVQEFEIRSGRLRGVRLDSGERLDADLCLLALGGVPEVSWLAESGLDTRGGVLCSRDLSVVGANNIVAAGDVARWPHPLFEDSVVNIGHWSNAAAQGIHAAHTLVRGGGTVFDHVPSFWSSVHGVSLRSVGLPALADEMRVLDGDPARLDATVGYLRRGVNVGFVGINQRVDALGVELGTRLERARSRPA